jgi:enoyl-CoA hydratase
MLAYSRHGTTGVLTLKDPPRNLLKSPLFADRQELEGFLSADDLSGVIVVGEGRHFCGGADLEQLAIQAKDPAQLRRALDQGKALLDLLRFATVPVVAAIRGQCLGAGLEIALACHLRIASPGAMLGFPETTHGLLPGLGGTVALGEHRVRGVIDLIVSGRLVDADEALSLGLLDRVVDAAQVEHAAELQLTELVGGKPVQLVRSVMESIQNGRRLPREEALRRETELFCTLAGARHAD